MTYKSAFLQNLHKKRQVVLRLWMFQFRFLASLGLPRPKIAQCWRTRQDMCSTSNVKFQCSSISVYLAVSKFCWLFEPELSQQILRM